MIEQNCDVFNPRIPECHPETTIGSIEDLQFMGAMNEKSSLQSFGPTQIFGGK